MQALLNTLAKWRGLIAPFFSFFCRRKMQIYTIPITKGETFFLELVVKDSGGQDVDLTDATPSIDVEETASLEVGDFTVTTAVTAETGVLSTIKIRAVDTLTSAWQPTTSKFQVWLNWPGEDIEDEIIMNAVIDVQEVLT